MKILKDECYIAIKAYKFTVSEIFRFFWYILSLLYCMSALSLIYRVYNSLINIQYALCTP